MLHLYFSRDRKQNTEKMLDRVCALAQDGINGQFLLVPEQFSHMAERRLCERGKRFVQACYGHVSTAA